MNRPSRELVNVDELVRRVSVEAVMRFYGIAPDVIHHVGDEIRTRCFLNCSKTEPTGDRALAIRVDTDAKKWCCHRYECEHKRGGNLVSLIDLVKPGDHMNGRPRGDRFKAILADLKDIAGGAPLSPSAAARTTISPPAAREPVKFNPPLAESPNERARTVVNLHEKFVTDPLAMSPAAAGYFRCRSYLTPELCAKWKMGYLPSNTGGDKAGGSMRGRICYPIHDERGQVLTFFGRDPMYETKLALWKAGERSQREPEKVHFVKGFHRGQELFGQHRLQETEAIAAIRALGHLLIVEGPNDVMRLDALQAPALGICSNRITPAQVEKVSRWANELDVAVAVFLDCDDEGDAGAEQAVLDLAKHCSVRLVWWPGMHNGKFECRQPENLSADDWEELRENLNR